MNVSESVGIGRVGERKQCGVVDVPKSKDKRRLSHRDGVAKLIESDVYPKTLDAKLADCY